MQHSIFWHTIHYLPMILTISAILIAVFSGKFSEYKKYIASFATFGIASHLMDSGFEFHSFEPCFFYVGVLAFIAVSSIRSSLVKTF